MEIIVIQPGGHLRLNLKSSNPSITTQGRLRCKQDVPYPVVQVHTPLHGVPRLSNNHRNGPPRKWGQRPHAFVDRPKSLTPSIDRSEEHTSELQSRFDLVCRLLLEKKS